MGFDHARLSAPGDGKRNSVLAGLQGGPQAPLLPDWGVSTRMDIPDVTEAYSLIKQYGCGLGDALEDS